MAEMDEILQTFLSFDRDGNGFIDRDEFAELVRVGGASMDDPHLDEAFRAVDIDGNGVIDFNEFIRWWYERMEGNKAGTEGTAEAPKDAIPVAKISPAKREATATSGASQTEVAVLREKLNIATQCERASKAEIAAVRGELRAARETIERQAAELKTLTTEGGSRNAPNPDDESSDVAALRASRDRLARENRELRQAFEQLTERLSKLRDHTVDALFRCGTD